MWNCLNCQETNEDIVELCWNYGSTVEGFLPKSETSIRLIEKKKKEG